MSILANLHLVVPTHNAKRSIIKLFVHVYQHISEVLLVVVQSVLSVLNVHMTKLVQIRNVLIHVRTLVVKMPNAESIIIAQSVIAWMVILEILSQDVILNHVRCLTSSLQ